MSRWREVNPHAPLTDWARDGIQPGEALARDEERQRVRASGYDAGWDAAWEVVTGGIAVDLPWPERLRLVKRITGAHEVYLGDGGATVIAHLSERIVEDDANAAFLSVPGDEDRP